MNKFQDQPDYDNNTKKSDSYQDVLQYFISKYQNNNSKCNATNMEFVKDTNVNIVGVRQYKPYNLSEVRKFKKFINK
ncbi:putative ORFan [Tupanvirus deep ocean]|uniref:ORFan n=2 Tax=Tupanvirus TaxID=2094720 RepID=A0AC62A7P4_9VIRU|nr:putative ORFan [Tupanvirus deep ocean]QKU33806.1 putative ORFan [Tupanvirus deep ocean]